MLETLELNTGPNPDFAVIWLHGLGADGHDFVPIVPELALDTSVRLVFPHAPIQPVTINGGMRMRAWYDILGAADGTPEDAAGIRASAAALAELIDREVERGVPARRIVLAGFSQGGAIALHTGLRDARPLGGILALSTYLPLTASLDAERSPQNALVPVFLAHGDADEVISLRAAEASRRLLEAYHYPVAWRVYRMGHSVCAAEVADIGAWLRTLTNAR